MNENGIHKAVCHLILRAERTRGGRVRSVKVAAVRIGHPALRADEAAIKLEFDIPETLFDSTAVGIVVDPSRSTLAVQQEPTEQ